MWWRCYWVIEPSFFHAGLHVHWLDFAAVLGLGGIWLALFAANLKRHALLPQNDPRIEYYNSRTGPCKMTRKTFRCRRKRCGGSTKARIRRSGGFCSWRDWSVLMWRLLGDHLVAMGAFARTRPLDPAVQERGIVIAPNQRTVATLPVTELASQSARDLVALRAREDDGVANLRLGGSGRTASCAFRLTGRWI